MSLALPQSLPESRYGPWSIGYGLTAVDCRPLTKEPQLHNHFQSMNKLLLTCFLALLCLVGRYLVAQSKVVRSPGAELLHRSDSPNREGPILPDIFLKETYGAEISSLPINSSGPWTVDGGPKYETASLRSSAPATAGTRSDDNLHRSSEIRNPKSEIVLPTSGFSLVDNSTSQGQEETPSAQMRERSIIDSLTIGDQIPSGIEFNSILNHEGNLIRLDDYRGKYLMLVFWSPTCSGSIGALPKIDQLSHKYKEQLKVVPITVFPEERVAEVLKIYPSFQKLSLPIATDASYLRALFPHFRIPHVVLVDPEGKIKAITGAEDVTEKNLDMLFSSGTGNFRTKVDRKILLNPNEKLISENTHLENKNIWLQSAFTGYIPDVGGSLIQNYEGFSHIRITNMTPIYMFQLAYSERDLVDYYGVNRIETRGFEKDELTSDKSGADALAWMEEGNHVFGYELIAPPSYDPYQLMREDLRRYFPHIEVTVETQSRKVLALIRQEGRDFPPSAGKPRSYQSSPMGVRMTNYPLQGFVYHLNAAFWRASPTPIINLTGIDYPVDLQLDAPLANYDKLRLELQKNGLDLIEREEEIKILVLKKIAPFKPLAL